MTGGGTGGHITPVLAVASELKKLRPEARLIYVGQKGGVLLDLPAKHPAIDDVYAVRAGKFRRYKGEGWRQVFDIRTQVLNIRDAIWVLIGIWQSFWLMRRLRPSVIFTRGGYVSVPVALGGKLCGVPYITHDSDSTPSLANRLIARWAAKHAVALPAELYPYPRSKTITTGVPVAGEYQLVDTKLQHSYKQEIGLDAYERILCVTGGGNGAAGLNKAVRGVVPELLGHYHDLAVVHLTGRGHDAAVRASYDETLEAPERHRVVVKDFTKELYKYSGAADIIVTRAGASSLAEFAVQGKACVVVPALQLAWQTHHAAALAKHHAILVVDEPTVGDNALGAAIRNLLDDAPERQRLGAALAALAQPDAAKQLAVLLLDQIPRHQQ